MKQELVTIPEVTAVPAVRLGVLEAHSPTGLIQSAKQIATPLAEVIQSQKLFTQLGTRKHVHVEGWTTLAMMLGAVAREVSVTESDGIFTATVELVRMTDGTILSRASAECGSPDEKDKWGKPIWANRPRYARRSMAITRATGKVCRIALSWIMVMAGYDPTPAEEIPTEDHRQIRKIVPPASRDERDIFPEPPIGSGSAEHRSIEARITEFGLNREGVKIWIKRRFSRDHFPDLNAHERGILMQEIPRLALEKQRRLIESMPAQELEDFLRSPPAWLMAEEMSNDKEMLLCQADERLKRIADDVANFFMMEDGNRSANPKNSVVVPAREVPA